MMPSAETEDERIAAALRAAHWPDSQGHPTCPRCYDGADLKPNPQRLRKNPAIRVYFCACCLYAFSDLVGTPLEGTILSIRVWAQAAVIMFTHKVLSLKPGWEILTRHRQRQLWSMQKRLAPSKFAVRWAKQLQAAGLACGELSRAAGGEFVAVAGAAGQKVTRREPQGRTKGKR